MLTLTTLTATACIIPQDDNVLEPLPAPLNRPPRIIPNLISPGNVPYKIQNGLNCPPASFSVAVEDPDVLDQINFAFYVDYVPNAVNFAVTGVLPASGRAQRTNLAKLEFQAAGQNPTSLFTVGTHFVDVIVADSSINPLTRDPDPLVLPDGGESTRYSDRYTWFVETVSGDCP